MEINKVLVFNIKGKAAHFKKYYSNKSSLTYKIPPRTVLMGMIASILKHPRDSYYELLSSDKAKFGVRINKCGSTHFECMNYLKEDGGHTQVRLQLLLPKEDILEYKVFFTHEDEKLLRKVTNKIDNNKYGYGLFLGQRQFRATAELEKTTENVKKIKNYSGELTTLTFKSNIKSIIINNNTNLTIDNMPVCFQKVKNGRMPEEMIEVCYEENGRNISGDFKEVIKVNDDYISFYTPIRGS